MSRDGDHGCLGQRGGANDDSSDVGFRCGHGFIEAHAVGRQVVRDGTVQEV
jgi:hypothetical protein